MSTLRERAGTYLSSQKYTAIPTSLLAEDMYLFARQELHAAAEIAEQGRNGNGGVVRRMDADEIAAAIRKLAE